MTPDETVHPFQVVEETATGPVANDDLPPIELGQLWMPADPNTAPRRIAHVGEGGHLGARGEHYIHFTTGDGQETLQLGRHFLEWVRVTGARPRAAPEAANNAGEVTS